MAVTGNKGAVNTIGSYNYGKPVQGARATSNIQSLRQVPQFDPKILEVDKDAVPLLVFIDKLGRSRTVGQTTFYHIEEDRQPATVTIDDGTSGLGSGSGYNSSDTTIGFGVSGGYLGGSGSTRIQANNVLKCVRTGEMMLVTSVDQTTGIATVTRGFTASSNGAAAAALNANEELQVLGTTFADNSQAPNSVSVEPLIITSYMQTFRTAVEAGRRLINSENYGGDEWKRMLASSLKAHQVDKEKAFLFNQGYATSGQTVTDGVINQIVSNVFQMNGTLDEVTLEEYWNALTRYNDSGSGCITLCGDNVLKCLDQMGRDGVRYAEDTNSIGVKVTKWKCAFGEMEFKRHGLFGARGSNVSYANNGYVGLMLTVNANNLGEATFKNSKLKFDPNCRLPGQDGEKACWTEDVGLEVWNERSHGYINCIDKP